MDRWRRHSTASHAWLSHLHRAARAASKCCFTAHDGAVDRAHAAAGVQCDPGSALVRAMDGYASLHTARNKQAAGDRYARARLRGDHSLTPSSS